MKKRILITGICGFVGAHLSRALNGNEAFEVHGFDSSVDKERDDIYEADIRNYHDVVNVFEHVRPDLVIHLAAILPDSHVEETCYHQVNVSGTRNVLNAMKRYGCSQIIFASSVNVYGEQENGTLNEDDMLHPTSLYGISKKGAEDACKEFSKNGIQYLILRFSGIFGEGRNAGVVYTLRESVLHDEVARIPSDGTDTLSFASIEDVVHSFIKGIEWMDMGKSDVFNITSITTTSKGLIDSIIDMTNSQARIVMAHTDKPRHQALDGLKAQKYFGFVPSNPMGVLRKYLQIK
ncbi:MAG TPA: NAD(P)-dependent oxidoreductase [Candidatus Paceibacterota bacterium]|nr:NAD(P)-dependent oxidoreductase [Candidatus Paceibacterota bacterium]